MNEQDYNVIDSKNRIEGKVTIMLMQCKKCGKEKLLPINRVHYNPRKPREGDVMEWWKTKITGFERAFLVEKYRDCLSDDVKLSYEDIETLYIKVFG